MNSSPESSHIGRTHNERGRLRKALTLPENPIFLKIKRGLSKKTPETRILPVQETTIEEVIPIISDSEKETPPNPELARMARDLFIEVSMAHPANFLTQSAAIVRRCSETGHAPNDLKMALAKSPELLENIRIAANNRHRRAREEHPGNTNIPEDISPQNNRHIIGLVFNWANTINILTDEELQEIIETYPNPVTSGQEASILTNDGLSRVIRRRAELEI